MVDKYGIVEYISEKDSNKYAKIVDMCAEGVVEGIADGLGHASLMVISNVMDSLYKKLDSISSVKAIHLSAGNVKRIESYKLLLKGYEIQVKMLGASNRYVLLLKKIMVALEDNDRKFVKGYRDDNRVVKLVYVTLYMSALHLLYILSNYQAQVVYDVMQGNAAETVDKYIQSKSSYVKVVENIERLFSDDAIGKALDVDIKDSKPFSLMAKNEENVKLIGLHSEATLDTVGTYVSFGLSNVLYFLFSPIRFIIYFLYRVGYGATDYMTTIDKTIQMYQANNTDTRQRLAGEIKDSAVRNNIKEIESLKPTEQDLKTDKFEI